MKNINLLYGKGLLIFTFFLIVSCTSNIDYKIVRDEIVAIHDSVMLNTEVAYKTRKKIDSLLIKFDSVKITHPELDSISEKQKLILLRRKIDTAEAEMEDWMHNFEVEKGEKSNNEASTYFTQEKTKIISIDSLYKDIMVRSKEQLKKY